MQSESGSLSDITVTTEKVLNQLNSLDVQDLPQFWRDVESVSVPVIKNVAGNDDERDVTFLWRSPKVLKGVYLFLNRVTDKQHFAKGMMNPVPHSDIWTLTLRLPATYRGSYTITEIPLETSHEMIVQLGGRHRAIIGQADPLSSHPGIRVRGGRNESVLALDEAPAQTEWSALPDAYTGELFTSSHKIAGQSRRVRLYIPDVPRLQPMGLLVLPDAEIWFDQVELLHAIDIAIKNKRIKPLAVLGIDNRDDADRASILGGNRHIIDEIADKLLPQVRKEHAERVWADRSQTVFCGQSLGGVTALMAALHASEAFGSVICNSPSMWWMPDKDSRPVMFDEHQQSWVTNLMLADPPKDVRIRLAVGSLEGATVTHVALLHQALLRAGVDTHLSVYTGGHDYAWWRGALIDGLAEL